MHTQAFNNCIDVHPVMQHFLYSVRCTLAGTGRRGSLQETFLSDATDSASESMDGGVCVCVCVFIFTEEWSANLPPSFQMLGMVCGMCVGVCVRA